MPRKIISRWTSNIPWLFYALKKVDLFVHYIFKRQFEPDFLHFTSIAAQFPGITIVDIGANIGQSAIGFSRIFPQATIYSFEANRDLEHFLNFCKLLIGKNFIYSMVGISEFNETVTLFVPNRGAVLIYGEATINRSNLDDPSVTARIGSFSVKETSISLVPFDQLGIKPDIVKIDVQGHEFSVLRGMMTILKECNPLILIERSHNDHLITEMLESMGYAFWVPSDHGKLIPLTPELDSVNMFCLPMKATERRAMVSMLLDPS